MSCKSCTLLLSNALEAKDVDLSGAVSFLKQSTDDISELRHKFQSTKDEPQSIAKSWKIDPNFRRERSCAVAKHFVELAEQERFQDREDAVRVSVFNATIDGVTRRRC